MENKIAILTMIRSLGNNKLAEGRRVKKSREKDLKFFGVHVFFLKPGKSWEPCRYLLP